MESFKSEGTVYFTLVLRNVGTGPAFEPHVTTQPPKGGEYWEAAEGRSHLRPLVLGVERTATIGLGQLIPTVANYSGPPW